MEIFKLFGSILVDSAEAEKSIQKTGKEAEGLGSKLKNGLATAAKWGAAITGAAVAVGGAMVAAAKDTAAAADEIDKASIRMGIDAESYQELAYAAGLSGVSMGTMEKAAKKLEGTDLNLDDAISQLMAIDDESQRAAAAAEMFGSSVAYEMTPLLQSGAEGLEAMRQEANDLGLVMSGDSVSAGAAMNDMFSKVEQSVQALKNGIMADLMPWVMELLQWLIDHLPEIQAKIKAVVDWIMPYIKPILEGVKRLVEGLFALLNGDFEGFFKGVKDFIVKFGTTMFNLGKELITNLWNGIKNVWASVTSWISEKISWLTDKLAFWKKGQNEMQTDGSHASGLNYVPYDGYVAELHRGEAVMNAGNTQDMIRDIVNGIAGATPQAAAAGPIELTLNIDGKAFARATYTDYMNEGARRGKALT